MDKRSEKILDAYALVFGNEKYREFGKQKSVWFDRIFDALNNGEPGFLEFVAMAEIRYGNIVSKDELAPTNSLIVKKMIKKTKENREKRIIDFFEGEEFNAFCKEVFNIIKESAANGNI